MTDIHNPPPKMVDPRSRDWKGDQPIAYDVVYLLALALNERPHDAVKSSARYMLWAFCCAQADAWQEDRYHVSPRGLDSFVDDGARWISNPLHFRVLVPMLREWVEEMKGSILHPVVYMGDVLRHIEERGWHENGCRPR